MPQHAACVRPVFQQPETEEPVGPLTVLKAPVQICILTPFWHIWWNNRFCETHSAVMKCKLVVLSFVISFIMTFLTTNTALFEIIVEVSVLGSVLALLLLLREPVCRGDDDVTSSAGGSRVCGARTGCACAVIYKLTVSRSV